MIHTSRLIYHHMAETGLFFLTWCIKTHGIRTSAGFWLAIGAVLCVVLPAGPLIGTLARAADQAVIEKIRFGEHPNQTRIVLDLSTPATFSSFQLDTPHRVVVDIRNATWNLNKNTPVDGLVTGYRTGTFRPGVARLVLETAGPIRILRSFTLPADPTNRHRIVLDIGPASRTSPQDNQVNTLPAPTGNNPVPLYRPQASPRSKNQKQTPQKKPMVVIDAGHGGADPGAISTSGRYEKHITLSMAKELKQILIKTGRYRATLTRNSDQFLRLRDRIAIARDADADVFLSIHADSIKNPQIRGLSVYTLSEQSSDKEAEALAKRENKADLIAGVDLTGESAEVTSILIDLAQRQTMNESAYLAEYLIKTLGRHTKLLRRTHRFAGFAVLKAPDVPSILIELGYLSNPKDERLLFSKKHRAQLAKGIVKGLDDYFKWRQQLR